MRANAGIFIIICLLFLVGTVGAVGIPDTVTVSTNKPWIVANNVDTSTITVTVMNTTFPDNGPVQGVTVNLAVDPLYGTLTPTTVTTDGSGKASSTFKVKTKSGAPQITATITAPALSNFTIQNIDHEVPVIVNLQYPLEGEVASEVPFNISVIDRWGNPIDGRNTPIHSVSLRIDGPDTYCGFKDGSLYPQTLTRTLDINGNQSVQVRLSKKIGAHNIQVASPFTMGLIYGIATGVPYSMTGSISDGGELPANNINKFVIDYFLYDIYGNPVQNRSLLINTNLTDELTPYKLTTNSLGQIQMTYGPKISILTAKITAISIDNASVNNTLIAKFISDKATNMVLALTPQTMGSWDIPSLQPAFVRATVIDQFGNPVPNELVTFNVILPPTYDEPTYNVTGQPHLDIDNATTDKDGNAIVRFYPGSFAANRTDPGYDSTASGSVEISAKWNTTIRYVKATWKNYPYLNIDTSAEPPSVKLNETIDITVNVSGNGYKMGGKAVTAILDMDCTGNMFGNPDLPYDNRANSSKAAAKAFVDEMKEGQDYIGLNSFGTYKNDKFDLPPQPKMDLVKTNIDDLVKGSTAGDFAASITDSMTNITVTQPFRPQDEVRAVIVLHDAGASSVGSAEENAIVSAALSPNPKIYLFTVLYYDGGSSSSNTEKTMVALANRTGGKFFRPESPDELRQAYIDIAGILRTLAGVNATLTLNFQKVEVNGTQVNGSEVFSYVPVEMGMTNPLSRTTILWQNNTRSFLNQSDEWNANHQLNFKIGTINISETWSATYRLRVHQTGLINIFNCTTSSLIFNDGTGNKSMCLPNLFITVNPNVTPIGVKSGMLDVSDLMLSGTIIDSIPVTWNLYYNGSAQATQTISYSYNNGPWATFDTRTNIPSSPVVGTYYTQMNVLGIKEGTYRIRVRAMAPDAPDDEMIIGTPPFAKRNATLILQ